MCAVTVHNSHTQQSMEQFWTSSVLTSRQSQCVCACVCTRQACRCTKGKGASTIMQRKTSLNWAVVYHRTQKTY